MGTKVTLIILFLFALLLRTWQLQKYPDAVDEDEMAMGYYGYSLATNGTDEYGNKYPIYFKSVGDYKYGLPFYFATLPVKIFGLNTFSTRVTSAFFGSLSVIAIYFLVMELFKMRKLSLISSFMIAISPMHIHFSRIAYTNIFGSFWAILTIIFFIKIIKKFDYKIFIFGIISLISSIYSYQAFRVILPLVFLTLPLFLFKEFKKDLKKKIILPLLGTIIVLLSFINPVSRARSSNNTSLINTPALVENFSEDNIAGTKLLVTRIFHNKLEIAGLDFAKRYLWYFDPKTIFIEQSSSSGRHFIPGIGLVYLVELPFFIYGLLKMKKSFVPLLLLAIAPIPGAMVADSVSFTRSVFLIYPISIISAYGIYQLTEKFKLNILLQILIVGLFAANFSFFVHQYIVHKTFHHPWYSDVGLVEMVEGVKKKIDNYDKVVISKGHYIPFLFVNKKLDEKLIFNMPHDCPALGQKKVLYVCFGYKVPKSARVLEVYRFKDGLPAIFLVDFNQKQEGSLPDRLEWGEEIPTYKLDEKDYWPTDNRR